MIKKVIIIFFIYKVLLLSISIISRFLYIKNKCLIKIGKVNEILKCILLK